MCADFFHRPVALKTAFLLSLAILFWGQIAAADDEYVFILRAKGNPYWNTLAAGIEETAKERRIRVTVFQSQSESSIEEQLNTCYTLIQKRPKVLSVAAANTASGIQCLKAAQKENIIVGDIDSSIPAEEAAKQGVKIDFSVGSDNLAIGREAGKYALTRSTAKSGKILILEGAPGNTNGKQRVDGFRDTLREAGFEKNIVASISADWDRLKAMNITRDVWQRFPDLTFVYAANDMMALGAVEALKPNTNAPKIEVLGIDGTLDGRKAVLNGELVGTVAQLPYLVGKRTVELAVEAAEYRLTQSRVTTDSPLLTRETLLDKSSPLLEYVR